MEGRSVGLAARIVNAMLSDKPTQCIVTDIKMFEGVQEVTRIFGISNQNCLMEC
jgi:hypothetical protein